MAERNLDQAARRAALGRSDVVAVGLTGGIGAGKSTALSMFREQGALTTSADEIVHDLYSRPEYVALLVEHFGRDIVDERGGVDRRRLAGMVKGRREELRWLEQLTHPLVERERFDGAVFDEFEGLQASTEKRVSGSHLAYHNDGSLDHMRAFARDAYGRAAALQGRR